MNPFFELDSSFPWSVVICDDCYCITYAQFRHSYEAAAALASLLPLKKDFSPEIVYNRSVRLGYE